MYCNSTHMSLIPDHKDIDKAHIACYNHVIILKTANSLFAESQLIKEADNYEQQKY